MMFNRTIIALAILFFTGMPILCLAEIDEATREELDLLKDEIIVLQDQLEEVNIGNANRMVISGYTDVEYKVTNKEGSEPGFRIHHMSLFFDKRLNDEWKFFSEIEYEDGPFNEFQFTGNGQDSTCKNCAGKIYLESVNFTYAIVPQVNLRAGRFFTPAGIWSIDHYPPFVQTQIRPQHIRKIFPQVVDGGTAFGTLSLGSVFLNYDAYVGNGEGNSGAKDLNSDKAVGLKLSFVVPSLFQYFEIGGTFYTDTLNADLNGNTFTDKQASGTHFKIRFANITLQSEYAVADIEPQNTSQAYKSTGYYLQMHYDSRKWTYGLRHDFFDADDTNAEETIYNTLFFNYHVTESITVKLEHHAIDNEVAKDYDETIASVVIYLGN